MATFFTDDVLDALIEKSGGIDGAIFEALRVRHRGQMTYEMWGRVGMKNGWTDALRAKYPPFHRPQRAGHAAQIPQEGNRDFRAVVGQETEALHSCPEGHTDLPISRILQQLACRMLNDVDHCGRQRRMPLPAIVPANEGPVQLARTVAQEVLYCCRNRFRFLKQLLVTYLQNTVTQLSLIRHLIAPKRIPPECRHQ